MHYESAKRPTLQQALPAVAIGAIVALIVEKHFHLSPHEVLTLYKSAYAVCFPLMLIGAFVYQHTNKLIEGAGLLIMNLSMATLGMICFYLLTSVLVN